MHGKESDMSDNITGYAISWIGEHMKDDVSITLENVLSKKLKTSSGVLQALSPDGEAENNLNKEKYLHIARRRDYSEICISYPVEILTDICERSGMDRMIRILREELGESGFLKEMKEADAIWYGDSYLPEPTQADIAAALGPSKKNYMRSGSKAPTAKQMLAEMDEDDRVLFEELRTLRKNIALSKSIAPYAVFSNRTLAAMCEQLPVTLEELRELPGVGKKNSVQYGEPFLEVIRKNTVVI